MKMTTSMRFALASGLLVALAGIAPAAEIPAVGTKAPDFSLKSQEGKLVDLHDFQGKWVVLYFYPKDMTPGCTIEAHNFQRDQAQYNKINAAVVGVSVDPVDSHVQFCTKENLTFKLLSDVNHKVVNMYGSTQKFGTTEVAARNTFILDPSGVIRKEFVKVNPTPHSQEVLAALAELQKGEK